MSLRIRHLQIRITTERGDFGVSLKFNDGLNVISAPNTSGKSTSMMSILYALGLEGMLGPSHQPPLPDAMRESIMDGEDEIPVVESIVLLEIENHKQERVLIQRLVEGTGDRKERQLVRTKFSPSYPVQSYSKRKDYYVRTSGAAQGRSGFHRFLAEFIGYDLPRVPANDKDSIPLYLECLFPYFFVDQMTGWRDIKARMPTYLRIPEMAKRSAEYILQLDVLRRAIEKQEFERRQAEVRDKWSAAIRLAKSITSTSKVIIRGIPNEPCPSWPPTPEPELHITDGTDWSPFSTAIKNLQSRLKQIESEELPQAQQVAQSVIEELQISEETLNRLTTNLHNVTRDLMRERAHTESVFQRLQALAEDYREYQDAKKLEDRKGELPLSTESGSCPTCHQPIKDVLLDQEHATPPMTLEQNMSYIRDQIVTFRDMHEDAINVVEAKEQQVKAISQRISDTNATIRALKQTLHSDGRIPSAAAIQEKLLIEQQVIELKELNHKFADVIVEFQKLSKKWARIQSRLKQLSKITLSKMDENKLSYLSKIFIEQLKEYGFSSFPIDALGISKDSYRPARGEYDVGLTSASDTIRIIWAYLIGLLEIDRKFDTNHLGFLVFDEPRQQGTKTLSFDALLRRAAECGQMNQQVIVATSEDREVLNSILEDIPCKYLSYDGKMLAKLE